VTFFRDRKQRPFEWTGRSLSLDAGRRQSSWWVCAAKPERFAGKLLRREGTQRMYQETDLQVLPVLVAVHRADVAAPWFAIRPVEIHKIQPVFEAA
jgi:hypothetical protein